MRLFASLGLVLVCMVGGAVSAVAAPVPPDDGTSHALSIPGGGGTPQAGNLDASIITSSRRLTPNAPLVGAPAGYAVTGIDVASYQGNVDWAAVAGAATSFALVKATEGTTYTNPYYGAQYVGALNAGLDVGSYAFGRPDADNPVQQADYLVGQSQPMTASRTLPFMLDLEGPYSGTGVTNLCWNLNPTQMVAWIRNFVNEVRAKTGMPTLIYTSSRWWTACTSNAATFSDQLLDIAAWNTPSPPTLPASWATWNMWQYADSGTLPGDQDVFNGTAADLAVLTYASTGPFRDVPASNPFVADIGWLVTQQITTGYSDGTFKPRTSVARQEMAAFLYRYEHPGVTATACASKPFTDVPATNPFCADIAALKAEGVVAGNGDGSFSPATSVSRQTMAAFLYRIANTSKTAAACTTRPFNDVPTRNPFCGDITWLVGQHVTAGYPDGGFHPTPAVARQEMAAFLHRLYTATH